MQVVVDSVVEIASIRNTVFCVLFLDQRYSWVSNGAGVRPWSGMMILLVALTLVAYQ